MAYALPRSSGAYAGRYAVTPSADMRARHPDVPLAVLTFCCVFAEILRDQYTAKAARLTAQAQIQTQAQIGVETDTRVWLHDTQQAKQHDAASKRVALRTSSDTPVAHQGAKRSPRSTTRTRQHR